MSLKDLLPPGSFDEITTELKNRGKQAESAPETINGCIMVRCPTCGRKIPYSTDNPFRPFCSERCKLIDLGAWANEERTIPGPEVNEDEDADLLSDPSLPVRNQHKAE